MRVLTLSDLQFREINNVESSPMSEKDIIKEFKIVEDV